MAEINLIFRDGRPFFEAYGCEGILLRFDAIEGTEFPTPGEPDGDTIVLSGHLQIDLESDQKLLEPKGNIGKVGKVGWYEYGTNPRMVRDAVLKINHSIQVGKNASLTDVFSELLKEFSVLPPSKKWANFYEHDWREFQHNKKFVR